MLINKRQKKFFCWHHYDCFTANNGFFVDLQVAFQTFEYFHLLNNLIYNMYDTVHPSVLAGRPGRRYRPAVQAVSIWREIVCFDWVCRKEVASAAVDKYERSSIFAVGRANHKMSGIQTFQSTSLYLSHCHQYIYP